MGGQVRIHSMGLVSTTTLRKESSSDFDDVLDKTFEEVSRKIGGVVVVAGRELVVVGVSILKPGRTLLLLGT
jgi:hypothetical protein